MASLQILSGLREIAPAHDALICDVWGVLHDGRSPFLPAAEALARFREKGPVILLSNAPRPVEDILAQFRHIGVPLDIFDAIVTSGVAAREDLAKRSAKRRIPMLHIGPERDRGVFAGLDIDCVDATKAEIVLCTGLWDDDHETPEDYRELLTLLRARGLPFLCANPDLVVQRGGALIYCAGALAKAYEEMGGTAIYYGKPYLPIYDTTLEAARKAAGRPVLNPLAIGDGIGTDIKGANAAGIEALFIGQGIHAGDLTELTVDAVDRLFAGGVRARAAMRALVW